MATQKTPKQKDVKKPVVKPAVLEKTIEKPALVQKKEVKNEDKVNVSAMKVLDNDTLKKLFQVNGCDTRTNASNTSKVVYNTFGTKSRVLQQGSSYQLLLTNGHKATKNGIEKTDNDDTKRFLEWYDSLGEEDKKYVLGADTIMSTKLSSSEMPREKSAKITSYDTLVKFIQYMATFEENKLATSEIK